MVLVRFLAISHFLIEYYYSIYFDQCILILASIRGLFIVFRLTEPELPTELRSLVETRIELHLQIKKLFSFNGIIFSSLGITFIEEYTSLFSSI